MTTIAIDIRPLLEGTWGGVSWFTKNLVDGLIQSTTQGDRRVVLFYNSFKKFPSEAKKYLVVWNAYQHVSIAGYTLPNKLLNLSTFLFNAPNVGELLEKRFGKIDYFISPNVNFTRLTQRIKHIAVCHDLSWEIFPECFTLRQKLWHRAINPQKFFQDAHKIIAVSGHTKQDLHDLYAIPESKITIAYPGVDYEHFNPEHGEAILERIQKKFDLPERYILFVGTLEPRKNIESLIEGYTRAKTNLPLIIVGKEGWKFDRIYRFWLHSSKKHAIRFIQKAEYDDLPGLYTGAEVFIYPSVYEGFGFPPLEALACGTPIIVGHGSSLPEIVGSSARLVDPFNIEDIAHALEELPPEDVPESRTYTWDETIDTFMKVCKLE